MHWIYYGCTVYVCMYTDRKWNVESVHNIRPHFNLLVSHRTIAHHFVTHSRSPLKKWKKKEITRIFVRVLSLQSAVSIFINSSTIIYMPETCLIVLIIGILLGLLLLLHKPTDWFMFHFCFCFSFHLGVYSCKESFNRLVLFNLSLSLLLFVRLRFIWLRSITRTKVSKKNS